MFAALYGELVPHVWRDPDSQHDAYQMFHSRSLAMGWLDDRAAGPRGGAEDFLVAAGLWAMNDAGWDHPLADPEANLISWFQVEASAVPSARPLPVQPFLSCAESTTARRGAVDLAAVQVLMPVQGLDVSSRPPYAAVPSMPTSRWFAEPDPQTRQAITMNINTGRDASLPGVVQQFMDNLAQLDQDVFTCTSYVLAGREAVLPPPFDDTFWNGPALNGAVLRGELVQWSCDAIGWLAEVVADSVAHLGVRSPLLFTVERVHSTG